MYGASYSKWYRFRVHAPVFNLQFARKDYFDLMIGLTDYAPLYGPLTERGRFLGK